jgi:hypothetical protein
LEPFLCLGGLGLFGSFSSSSGSALIKFILKSLSSSSSFFSLTAPFLKLGDNYLCFDFLSFSLSFIFVNCFIILFYFK